MMKWDVIKSRLSSVFDGHAAEFTLPSTILEIEPAFVAGARLDGSGRRPRALRRMGVRQVEPRSLDPAPNRANFAKEPEILQAIHAVTEAIGKGGGHFGLVVPDGAVRVGILNFETLPTGRKETDALVRWKMRENLPCAPEEARLSYQVVRQQPGSVELLVVAAKSSVLAEYELALERSGGACALLLPATMALLPLLPEQPAAAQFLFHLCSGTMTSVVLESGRVVLWRSLGLGDNKEEEVLREAASEASRVLASARDRLRLDIGKAWVCARPPLAPGIERLIAEALSIEVAALAPHAELASALSEHERTMFGEYGAAFAGLMVNPS